MMILECRQTMRDYRAITILETLATTALREAERRQTPYEQKVVDDFQRPRDKEGRVHQRGPSKQEAHKQWTHGGASSSCYARDSRCCGSFFRTHNRHGVRLPGRHIHLTDTETHQQN